MVVDITQATIIEGLNFKDSASARMDLVKSYAADSISQMNL